ncbi:HET-domain-containing protein [Melanomma pulvis-pyrius CBS 109.77]|uniref:HET-domain-containing protein n=1 Tax=Melanomma pulvis-pyrius CBS 109.77 TaxID=1314802 RepID=A0A6A6XRI8_9PLEO|nr:HET-domain-containing protein [Melanomma pulvis-pyrius CBS 109.77]
MLHRSTSMPPKYQYLGIGEASSIRLLTLLPGLPQDTVRVTLTEIDMAGKHDPSFPLYECLSYTWGSGSERTSIYVDNKVITVTKNLAEALIYLRHYEIPRVMWIDALCINQGDMAERSTQVARMSDIYFRATRVNVWLGAASDDSVLAMKTLIELSETIDLDLETQTFRPLDDPGNWVDRHTLIPWSDEQINAICNLLNRPWFERLWVWQEVRLGNANSLIMVGHESMLWRRFYVAGFFLRWKREFGLRARYIEMEPRIEIVNGMMNNITQSPMATLSLRTCFSKCSEPRDRVYALMGITTDNVTLKPDYSLSVGDIYKDVALQHLSQLNNLELLSSCCNRTDNSELPTWAPDWRIPNQRKRWFDLVGAGEPAAHARYIAPNVLEASGVAIDKIIDIKPFPNFDLSDEEILESLRELAPPSLQEEPYPHGVGTKLDAYCRTFFADEFTERYKPAGELLNFQNFPDALELLSSDTIEELDSKRVAHFVKDFKIQTAHRSLAITNAGYIALVPDDSVSGDEIYHILGSRWPIVLRPQSNQEELAVVGFAYVDGDNDRETLLGPYPKGWSGVALYDAPTGKWWPMSFNGNTKQTQVEDPRLGPLPKGWKVKEHKEGKLWNWYVEDVEGEPVKAVKEVKMRSDPRFSVEMLKERGIAVQVLKLV